MEGKEIIRKRTSKKRRSLSVALPLYILYLLVVRLYFGFHVSELWSRFPHYRKMFTNYIKQKNRRKFIRIKI